MEARDKRRPALCALQFRFQGRIQQTGLWQEMDESGLHPWVWGAVTCLRIQAKSAEGKRRSTETLWLHSLSLRELLGDSLPNLKGLLEFLSL